MEIPVLIETVQNNGFRARCGEPLALSAEEPSAEAALNNLQMKVASRLQNGAQLTSLKVGSLNGVLREEATFFREDDPIVQEWLQIMKENREQAENDPTYL